MILAKKGTQILILSLLPIQQPVSQPLSHKTCIDRSPGGVSFYCSSAAVAAALIISHSISDAWVHFMVINRFQLIFKQSLPVISAQDLLFTIHHLLPFNSQ